ncbi:hypothetical protein [Polaribacter sp. IC073]|uniref:hypothetical protein n=1 Tax=Polaribacter sp. IC073 TaxID=2508540 RepID=UPI0011BFD84A|nr:hypothetical protein [Polaribacter sp. IC073]TXD49615.1 hypothetical protein ES045_00050 [Polaribacter sp. IC073]
MRNLIFTLFCIISIQFVSAQDGWKKGVSIGQASDNSYTKSLPAQYIAIYPSDATSSNSQSINGFVGLDFYKTKNERQAIKLSISYELHKNNLIDKEQNVYQFGVSIGNIFSLSKSMTPSYLLTDISIKKSEDKVEDKKGMQYLAYASFTWSKVYKKGSFLNYLQPNRIYPGNQRTNIPPTDSKKEEAKKMKEYKKVDWSNLKTSDIIQIKHNHAIGLENIAYENLTMYSASFNIEVYPFSGLLYSALGKYQFLKFHYNISHRNTLGNYSGNLFIGNLIKKGISLNYKIDNKDKTVFSLGYEHAQGGNPLKGLKDNTFGQLTIGAKVNL